MNEGKQVLRKHISTEVIGNIETLKNEYIVKDLLTNEEIQELEDYFSDESWERGIHYSYDDEELYMIELDKLAENIGEIIADNKEEEEDYFSFKKIAEKIEPYRAYTMYFEEAKKV